MFTWRVNTTKYFPLTALLEFWLFAFDHSLESTDTPSLEIFESNLEKFHDEFDCQVEILHYNGDYRTDLILVPKEARNTIDSVNTV